MAICHRELSLQNDLAEVLNLADVSGLNIPHIADWPYRFSSWAMDELSNTRGWYDSSSRLIGWAAIQTRFWAIDCVAHPEAPAHLYREMISWAKSRVAEMAAGGAGRPMWFVSISAVCLDQRCDLESLGFEDVSDIGEDSWSKVLLEFGEDSRLPPIHLPSGFQIRSLDIHSEIQAYVDLHREVFQSENMTHGWRTNATRMTGYINDLDIIISSDAGELCGFCVAWLRHQISGECVGQIEPLGVRESHRGQKLSQALLAETIRRLRNQGARSVFVETDKQRSAVMSAYASVGFRVVQDVLVYRHVVAGS